MEKIKPTFAAAMQRFRYRKSRMRHESTKFTEQNDAHCMSRSEQPAHPSQGTNGRRPHQKTMFALKGTTANSSKHAALYQKLERS